MMLEAIRAQEHKEAARKRQMRFHRKAEGNEATRLVCARFCAMLSAGLETQEICACNLLKTQWNNLQSIVSNC